MRYSLIHGLAAAGVIAMSVVACGGGNSGGSTPTTPTSPTTPSDVATITIGADGRVTPASVTIPRGGRVTMINNHNLPHDMSSDPHPEHNQCPELNQWGFLTPGQQRTSGNLNTARTCGFHDHNLPANADLQGRVIIQ